MKRFVIWILCLALICTGLGVFVLYVHRVPNSITPNDAVYIQKINENSGFSLEELKNTNNFEKQIERVLAVQQSAFDTTPNNGIIPDGTPREPENLYRSNVAQCFDRARYIDKALRHLGFNARYVGIYENEEGYSMLQTMITPSSATRVQSHAAVEVETVNGWLIVDTRKHWISLTKQGQPVSMQALQKNGYDTYEWSNRSKEGAWPLMQEKFYVVYGLYSRHGQFYPPYTKYIPDINWNEFIRYNLEK